MKFNIKNLLLRTVALAVLALVLVLPRASLGALEGWDLYPPGQGGPWGGGVRQLATPDINGSPLELWAATEGGAYYSDDSGLSWNVYNDGFERLDLSSIAVCASNPSVVLASTRRWGFYLRDEAVSASWQRLTIMHDLDEVTWIGAVAIDPFDENHLFVGSDDTGASSYVFESFDQGLSWAPIDLSGNTHVTRMIFSSTGDLFYSTKEGNVYKYDGATNTRLNPTSFGMVNGSPVKANDLALPGGTGAMVAVAAAQGGVWVGIYGGGTYTWDQRYEPAAAVDEGGFPLVPEVKVNSVTAIAADPADVNRILFYAFDYEGFAFSQLSETTPLGSKNDNTVMDDLPEDNMNVRSIMITPGAEFVTEGKGGIFTRAGNSGPFAHDCCGLGAYSVNGFDFSPSGADSSLGDHEIAVTGGNLFAYGNSGMNFWNPDSDLWERIPSNLDRGLYANSSRLIKYATDSDLWMSIEEDALYKSTDYGASWNLKLQDYVDAGTIYSISFGASPAIAVAGTNNAIYYTGDAGVTWTRQDDPSIYYDNWITDTDIRQSFSFYAAGSNAGGGAIYRYTGTSGSWARVDDGATFSGLYGRIISMVASQKTGGVLYAGTYGDGLFRSTDGGATWSLIADGLNGLPLFGEVDNITIGKWDGDILIAANYYGDGVYVSGDQGKNWHYAVDGLLRADGDLQGVGGLHFTPDGKALVAGLQGMGLWALPTGSPPYLDNPGTYTVYADNLFTYIPVAADVDAGSTLEVRAVSIPGLANFDGTTLTWTPGPLDMGLHSVTFAIVEKLPGGEDFYNAEYDIIINVGEPNNAPVLDPIGDRFVKVGEEVVITVTATDADAEDVLSFTAYPMPAGATFADEAGTWTFRWTPTFGQRGLNDIEFIVTDTKEFVSEQIIINVNSEPTVPPIADYNWELNAIVGELVTIDLTVVEHDGDLVDYSHTGPGMLTGSVYTFTPPVAGDYIVTFTIDDNNGHIIIQMVTIKAAADGSTVGPTLLAVGDRFVNMGDTLSFQVRYVRPENDTGGPIVVGPDGTHPGTWSGDLIDGGTYSWTPQSGDDDTTVTFRAVEAFTGLGGYETITIVVNNPPVLDPIGDKLGVVGESYTYSTSASDLDGDTITYQAEGLPPWASIDPVTGDITWEPRMVDLSNRSVLSTIIANDMVGGIDSENVTFTANTLPLFSEVIADKSVWVDGVLNFTVAAYDRDRDVITFELSGLPVGATIDPDTGEFFWTPTDDIGSPFTATVTLRDSWGGEASQSFTVTVSKVDDGGDGGGGDTSSGGDSGGGCFISTFAD